MNNGTTYQIAQAEDLENIYAYAEAKLKTDIPDDMERMIAIWESRFRKEALEHYLKLGWSFVATSKENKICGFFLGQPLLFFQGQTQTLWVEYILADDLKIKSELADIAYKLSRDKHFQQVIFPENVGQLEFEKPIPFQKIKEPMIWAKTTK
jgi:hypothetical protein